MALLIKDFWRQLAFCQWHCPPRIILSLSTFSILPIRAFEPNHEMTGWQPGPRRDWLHCPLHNISHDTNIVPRMEITWKHKNKLKSWQRSWGVHYSILIRAVFCLGSNVYGITTTAWGGIKSLVFNKIFNNLGLGENFAFEGLVQIMR